MTTNQAMYCYRKLPENALVFQLINRWFMEDEHDIQNFIYQMYNYRGKFTPQNLVFNANLQEFATDVSYISNLQTLGKLSPEEAYKQIKLLWQLLERSYLELGIDTD